MKIIVLVVILISILVVPTVAFPSYTITPGEADGTYGPSGISTVYYDETGNQLFDGQYGKIEWMNLQPVLSIEDYYNRYDDQKGYALPWVGWRTTTPIITFDMEKLFDFNQVGIHACYEAVPGTYLPGYIVLSFSDNGTEYTNELYQDFGHGYNYQNHNSYWLNFNFTTIQARFVKIQLERSYWVLIDEASINGMDGTQFAAAVPEPSSLVALLGGMTGSFAFRRRRRRK